MNLLLAAVLLMQDKTAEDSFKKIEEQILRSKTLRVEFTLSTEEGGKKRGSPGSLLLKEGNKVHFSMDTGETLGPQKLMATALCDGTMMLQAYGPLGRSDEAVPTFNLAFRMTFARLGLSVAGSFCAEYPVSRNVTTLDIPAMLTVSDLKAGENDAALKTITYQVQVNKAFVRGLADPVQVKTWYDPVSFKPVKRQLTTKTGGKEKTILETYSGLTLDEAIPDDKFKLPEEKK